MKREKIFNMIEDALIKTEVVGIDISEELHLKNDIGLDSLDIVVFTMNLEDDYNVFIEDEIEDKLQFMTVGEVVDYLEKKIK